MEICTQLRVPQRVPVYVEGQVQVPGLEQVPPFPQAGEQTATTIEADQRLNLEIVLKPTCCTSSASVCRRASTSTRTRTGTTIRTNWRTYR